jgi:hypothetical protein
MEPEGRSCSWGKKITGLLTVRRKDSNNMLGHIAECIGDTLGTSDQTESMLGVEENSQ